MGKRTRGTNDKATTPTRKLVIKKETIRKLEGLSDDDLRQAGGGARGQEQPSIGNDLTC